MNRRTGRSGWTALICTTLALFMFFQSAGAGDAALLIEKVFAQDTRGLAELIDRGVDVNARDDGSGSTALMLACLYGFTDMAGLLIRGGADPNIQANNGMTALMAASQTSVELVELLLEGGADIHIRSADGSGAFTRSIMGVMNGAVGMEVPELLLARGSDVDEELTSGEAAGYTPLMMAAKNNHRESAWFLIQNGADVNRRARNGSTPLSLAREENHGDIVRLLQEHGAVK